MSISPNDPTVVAEVACEMAHIGDEFEEIVIQGIEGGDQFECREEDYTMDGICFVVAVIGVAIACQLFWRK